MAIGMGVDKNNQCVASGQSSFAAGSASKAYAAYSVAVGYQCEAGEADQAWGAKGSFAGGTFAKTEGEYSFAFGSGTKA